MTRLILTLTAMATAIAPAAAGKHLVRYRDLSGPLSLTLSQEIEVTSVGEVMAGRDLAFDLSLARPDPGTGSVTLTIDRARASYEAHGMKQRLGTHQVTGRSVSLPIEEDGRTVGHPQASDDPSIDMGPMVGSGLSVAGLLADTLPVLPEQAVSVGSTWTSERTVRSLEGWAFGTGVLTSRHRVTAVEERDSRTVITGETEGSARLVPEEGSGGFTGDLKRTLHWVVDATVGRLLSLSMEQKTEGDTSLPKGETGIRQTTRIEITPGKPGPAR